jgi:hypothetical protein
MIPTAILGIPAKGEMKLNNFSTPHSLLMVNLSYSFVEVE